MGYKELLCYFSRLFNILHLSNVCSIIVSMNFAIFNEGIFCNFSLKFFLRNKVIVFSMNFSLSWTTSGKTHTKFKVFWVLFH